MSSAGTQMDLTPVQAMNSAPAGFDPARDLPAGFLEFLIPLHRSFTPSQRDLVEKRTTALAASHQGRLPNYLPSSPATKEPWEIELPSWGTDQRNQMTGAAGA